ncbi:MAG: D-amino-acid transaminase [Gammaproteobacteria bacterium]|nr:D-amino-acid transaminase [Gammaproteobacteria bacterium]
MNNIKQVYLNGEFVPADTAQVSAFDRGFIFGDGVYEVIPVFGGRSFRLEHHLQRLDNSLKALGITLDMTRQQWSDMLDKLAGDDSGDQYIYMQVTRGPAPRDHVFPASSKPTVFAYATPLKYPDDTTLANGVNAVTAEDIRWLRCDIKAIALLAAVMLREQAKQQGAVEAILLRDHMLTEGAASNIFIVKNNVIATPGKGRYILPGITRDLVVELAQANNVAMEERDITEAEVFDADEVWLTSSTKEILPITTIDGKPVGSGKPGAMHEKMFAIYRQYKQDFRDGKVD